MEATWDELSELDDQGEVEVLATHAVVAVADPTDADGVTTVTVTDHEGRTARYEARVEVWRFSESTASHAWLLRDDEGRLTLLLGHGRVRDVAWFGTTHRRNEHDIMAAALHRPVFAEGAALIAWAHDQGVPGLGQDVANVLHDALAVAISPGYPVG